MKSASTPCLFVLRPTGMTVRLPYILNWSELSYLQHEDVTGQRRLTRPVTPGCRVTSEDSFMLLSLLGETDLLHSYQAKKIFSQGKERELGEKQQPGHSQSKQIVGVPGMQRKDTKSSVTSRGPSPSSSPAEWHVDDFATKTRGVLLASLPSLAELTFKMYRCILLCPRCWTLPDIGHKVLPLKLEGPEVGANTAKAHLDFISNENASCLADMPVECGDALSSIVFPFTNFSADILRLWSERATRSLLPTDNICWRTHSPAAPRVKGLYYKSAQAVTQPQNSDTYKMMLHEWAVSLLRPDNIEHLAFGVREPVQILLLLLPSSSPFTLCESGRAVKLQSEPCKDYGDKFCRQTRI
ncbi:hypothetical protein EYF80_005813 [Liparis tanakae]|uniref:Uncharacterized protein n=1 Tax=Liparis tanakae TaxID=230148 RepID=A0A4Z2J373_9TELE|nr:hypothetical protein EYF80_005813 [Liparis tanakae]